MNKIFKKYKIGIMGVGFVGGAAKQYFDHLKVPLYLYDKYKKMGSLEEVNKADLVFICVPTPYLEPGGFDLSMVKEAIGSLKQPKIVVVKSSIVPGATEALQKQFPKHKILFNPEFLREVSPYYDMIHPDRQLVGYTNKSKLYAKDVLALLPKAPYEKILKAAEAEMIKYMANTFLSLKVVYANEFYEICKKMGINYEPVSEALGKDPRIGDSHFKINFDGYRGYGGSCFPKDVNAIIQAAEAKKANPVLLKTMRKINRGLLKQSGLNENYFLTEKHKKKK